MVHGRGCCLNCLCHIAKITWFSPQRTWFQRTVKTQEKDQQKWNSAESCSNALCTASALCFVAFLENANAFTTKQLRCVSVMTLVLANGQPFCLSLKMNHINIGDWSINPIFEHNWWSRMKLDVQLNQPRQNQNVQWVKSASTFEDASIAVAVGLTKGNKLSVANKMSHKDFKILSSDPGTDNFKTKLKQRSASWLRVVSCFLV